MSTDKFTKRFCPRCGSTNIRWLLPQDWSKWECPDCGYMGPFVIEDGKIAEQIHKEYLKNQDKIHGEGNAHDSSNNR
ncbi:MAG: transposase [Candidatus Thermoplasmatota archaeon]|nr:transposase [Candidatus Thermoplasmatota archaeon]MBU1940380.1 transposase [Candidatus Thermoplasmatota archaeon]